MRPFWDSSGRKLTLKVTGAPKGNPSLSNTITMAAASVTAGGIAFGFIVEGTNNSINTPSGWTKIGEWNNGNDDRCALYYALTPSSVDTSFVKSRTQQASVMWTMRLTDDADTVVPITGYTAVASNGFVDLSASSFESFTVNLGAGDIYAVGIGGSDGGNLSTFTTTGGSSLGARVAGVSSFLDDVFFAGSFIGDPYYLDDSGTMTFSGSSLATGVNWFGGGATFQLVT